MNDTDYLCPTCVIRYMTKLDSQAPIDEASALRDFSVRKRLCESHSDLNLPLEVKRAIEATQKLIGI